MKPTEKEDQSNLSDDAKESEKPEERQVSSESDQGATIAEDIQSERDEPVVGATLQSNRDNVQQITTEDVKQTVTENHDQSLQSKNDSDDTKSENEEPAVLGSSIQISKADTPSSTESFEKATTEKMAGDDSQVKNEADSPKPIQTGGK